ncbi:MAG: NUDIX domain-containing protein [Leadbetterella sp.]|nr:NUDIX domain-containing protein [Leadbetterella sp.]
MEKLEEAHKFKLWRRHLQENGLKIENIEEVYTRRNSGGEVLFSLLMLDAGTPEGHKMPPICFLKGEVVTVLVCLTDRDTREKYLVLVRQRRIAEGAVTYEHPAGMVDNTKTPREIAVQEVREETGLQVREDQLRPVLADRRLFPSTGTSDECMYLFFIELQLGRQEILELSDRKTGVDDEHITTLVLPFKEAHRRLNNTNCILLNLAYLKEVEDWDLLKKISL